MSKDIYLMIPQKLIIRFSVILFLCTLISACNREEKGPPTYLYSLNLEIPDPILLLSDSEAEFWGVAWSPDGRQIVFSYLEFDSEGTHAISTELYLANTDGTNLRQLTTNGRSNYLPAWSPDGQTISYVSQDMEEGTVTAEIYTIRVDGQEETRLTYNDAYEYGSSWSPDGSMIVFGSERGGEWQIYTMNADGSDQQPLPTPAHGNAPDWSPDGGRIVFTSDRTGLDDIWVMNTDGSGQTNLTNSLEIWDDNPRWSPDGNWIAFNSGISEQPADIWIMRSDGSRVVNILNNPLLDAIIPSWAPDSSDLMFHASEVNP